MADTEINLTQAPQPEAQDFRADFEANMLDGDSLDDCGGAMLSAKHVYEYVAKYIATGTKNPAQPEPVAQDGAQVEGLRPKILGGLLHMGERFYLDGLTGARLNVAAVVALTDTILALIATATAQTAKAYGGCEKCYGKGYATVNERWSGYDTDTDIGSPGGHVFGGKDFAMKFCTCERGKQLERLTTRATREAYERGRIDTRAAYEAKVGDLAVETYVHSKVSEWANEFRVPSSKTNSYMGHEGLGFSSAQQYVAEQLPKWRHEALIELGVVNDGRY